MASSSSLKSIVWTWMAYFAKSKVDLARYPLRKEKKLIENSHHLYKEDVAFIIKGEQVVINSWIHFKHLLY